MTHNLALCLFGDVQSSFKTIRETKQIHQNYLEKNNVKGIYKPTQALSLGEGAVQVRVTSGQWSMTPWTSQMINFFSLCPQQG